MHRILLAWGLILISSALVRADDWPQWMGPNRDGVWRETGIIDKFPEGGPPVLWRTPIRGGYSGPSIIGDRVFITDKVLNEDQHIQVDPFDRTPATSVERVLCLHAGTGEILWKDEYPCVYTISYAAGPRTTPAFSDGLIYALGAEGDLRCLNAESGKLVWAKNFKQEFALKETPVWGFSSNPLIDGDKLILIGGGEGTGVVAYHKKTGALIWKALSGKGEHGMGYSSPVIYEVGGTRQLIIYHPRGVASLNPETGKLYWELPFESQKGLAVVTPRLDANRLFVCAFYDGAFMLKLDPSRPAASVLWERGGSNEKDTDALHGIFVTPVFKGDTIYGADSYGEYRAIDAANGDRIWQTFEPTTASKRPMRWGSCFTIEHGNRYVMFSEGGDLIFASLSRTGYVEHSRAHLLEPTGPAERRDVVWSHPAFAHKHVFARNDKEIICVDLSQK